LWWREVNIWNHLSSSHNPTPTLQGIYSSRFTLGDWLAIWSGGTHIPTAYICKLKVIFMQFLFICWYLGLNVWLYFDEKKSQYSVSCFLPQSFKRNECCHMNKDLDKLTNGWILISFFRASNSMWAQWKILYSGDKMCQRRSRRS
jgi:hypothetical protein